MSKRSSAMEAATWVLLVDPREWERSVRAFALWVRGYEVLRAGSIEEALELLEGAELVVLEGWGAAMGAAIGAVRAAMDAPPVLAVGAAQCAELGPEDGAAPARMAEILEQARCLLARRHARARGWSTRAGGAAESPAARRERIRREEVLSGRGLREDAVGPSENGVEASAPVTFVTPEHSAKVFASN